jgi:hypothetical protein
MKKAVINSTVVTTDENHRVYKDITQIIFQNYSDDKITVTANSVSREVPKSIVVDGVVMPQFPLVFNALGDPFDIEIDIAFTAGLGKCIIDTTTIINY